MTTLSTHDTKRAEDVRARLSVLSEMPEEWALELSGWRSAAAEYRPAPVDPNTEYLIWQTLVGAWPIDAERLTTYLDKAVREAKLVTTWTTPNEEYETAVRAFAEALLADESVMGAVAAFVDRLAPYARIATLGQKIVQLTMPGVPDVYQGCEIPSYALVDPDNRRPVDVEALADLLRTARHGPSEVSAADTAPVPVWSADQLAAEKMLVTSTAVRLRREHPEWCGAGASYEPLEVTSDFVIGFVRGGRVATLATRLGHALERAGGFESATATLPAGTWRDALSGRTVAGGAPVLLAPMIAAYPAALPVALFVRD